MAIDVRDFTGDSVVALDIDLVHRHLGVCLRLVTAELVNSREDGKSTLATNDISQRHW